MKTKPNPRRPDKTANVRQHRRIAKERATGITRVLLKVPTEQVAHFKELAAAAMAAKDQPAQPAE